MGGNESTPLQKQIEAFDVISSDQINKITYFEGKSNGKHILVRKLVFHDDAIYGASLDKHAKRLENQDSGNVQKLIKFEDKLSDDICSTIYQIYAMWQHFPRSLEDQIRDRSIRTKPFTQSQIQSLLSDVIKGLAHFQKHAVLHERLTSENIKVEGNVNAKVIDPLSMAALTNIERVSTSAETDRIYLSPEQCQSLELQASCLRTYKSDVWTLGMITLQAGMLDDMNACYKEDCRRVDFVKVEENLDKFSQKYPQLEPIVRKMLSKNKNDRPDWIELATNCINFEEKVSETRKSPEVINYQRQHSYQSIDYVPNLKTNPVHVKPVFHQQYTSTPTFGRNIPPLLGTNIPPSQGTNILPGQVRNYAYENQLFQPQQRNQILTFGQGPPTFRYQAQSQLQNQPQLHNLSQHNHQSPIHYQPTPMQYHQPPIQYQLQYQPFKQLQINSSLAPVTASIVGGSTIRQPLTHQNPLIPQRPASNNQYAPNKREQNKIDNVMQQSAGFHKIEAKNNQIIGHPEFSKFMSHTSSEGYLFANVKFEQSHQYQKENQKNKRVLTEYKAMNIPSAEQATKQKTDSVKPEPVAVTHKLNNLKDTYIKNAESITYETDAIYVFRDDKKSPKKQSQQSLNKKHNESPRILQNMKKENLVSRNDEDEEDLEYVIETFKQGSRYEGYKLNNMRHGSGKFYYQDGGMYDGEWVNNKMHGFGRLYYQNGSLAYEGNWKEDQFHGRGKLFNDHADECNDPYDFSNFDNLEELWEYYEGEFVEDLKEGRGKLVLSNNEYFVGCFQNDMIEGPGKFHSMDGQVVKGTWSKNMLEELSSNRKPY